MKNFLASLAAALFATAAFASQTIVVVDMEAVLAKHPNTAGDKKLLESTLADYTKERDELRREIELRKAELERKAQEAQNPMLAPAKAEELRKACQADYEQIEALAEKGEAQMAERSRTLTEMERKLIQRSTDEIQEHIAAYAKEKGYALVLYKNLVPYVEAKYDITDQIIILCGGLPDRKSTAKDASELKAPATLR